MDIALLLSTSSPLSSSSSSPASSYSSPGGEGEGGRGDEPSLDIVSLEREFQQVRKHIRLLVQKKARLLRKIHQHKTGGAGSSSGEDPLQQQHILERWKDVVSRYLYANEEDAFQGEGDEGDSPPSSSSSPSCSPPSSLSFPLFNMLPNEVILQVFNYLDASHLCRTVMRTCNLFCAIALDETLWRPLYRLNWGDHMAHHVYTPTSSPPSSPSPVRQDGDRGGTRGETGAPAPKREGALGEGDEGRMERKEEGEGSMTTWRTLFTRQSCTESNWWRGRYSVNTLEEHKGAVRCMHYSGDTLVTGSADKTVRIWNMSDGKCTTVLHDNKWVRCLRYDATTSTLVTTGMDSTQAKIWDLTTNTVAHVLDVQRGWITSLQLSTPRIVTGSLDGKIRVWDAAAPASPPYLTLNSGHDSLRSLCLHGDMIMSAGIERNLLLWDIRVRPTTTPAATVEGAPQGNYCAKFDLQTHMVASGSNGIVAVGDLRAAKTPPLTLKGHTDVVSCLQFAGRKLVTGSMDQTTRVWDVADQRCAHTLHGHESWVWDLQFDPDKVVTVSGDKTVKMWEFNLPSRIAVL